MANVTQDWPLINHLWTGWLPQDVDEANQLRQLGEICQACGNKLQVLLLAMATSLSIGWMYHHSWLVHNCWQTLMTPWGTAGGIIFLLLCVGPIGGQVCMQI